MALKTLIVEDDKQFRKIVEIRLQNWDREIDLTVAESIGAAREILDADKEGFSLVILDQHLPDGMGIELFDHPSLEKAAVLAVSADDAPEIPGRAVKAGAQHFLGKTQITGALFLPLLEALLERKELEAQLMEAKLRESRLESIKTLLATLRHEINNPLGAVLGGTYLLRTGSELDKEQADALQLIEASGNRIKHVVKQLCEAADLEEVTKGNEQVYQVPGDAPWEDEDKED